MKKKLVCIGACYVDTILDVPQYPGEDSKLRATNLQVRRGGNCPNTLQVLQQLLPIRGKRGDNDDDGGGSSSSSGGGGRDLDLKPYLISCLPRADAPATATITGSFGPGSLVDFTRCIFREDHHQPASSYIIRSEATGSRTLVNYNDLPEMTVGEFVTAVEGIGGDDNDDDDVWFHFENSNPETHPKAQMRNAQGRIPETTLQCIRHLRRLFPNARVSVEVEKPGREGLQELAAEADVVFYSRSWAESKRYGSAQQCLSAQSGVARKATVGAGDTFIAGMLFGLLCHHEDWDTERKVQFAVQLATRKVQRDGFDGLGLGLGSRVLGVGGGSK
ncbi:Ribokinase-like protein [Daldinia bambusicola]|nr:Ribokinase-like protein [Daldinia bambusicola]